MNDELRELQDRLKLLLAESAELQSKNQRLREHLAEAVGQLDQAIACLVNNKAQSEDARKRRP